MSMIMILIPLSLVLVAAAVWAFFWAVNSGQFDDLESPAWEILTDTAAPSTAAQQTTAQPPITAEH